MMRNIPYNNTEQQCRTLDMHHYLRPALPSATPYIPDVFRSTCKLPMDIQPFLSLIALIPLFCCRSARGSPYWVLCHLSNEGPLNLQRLCRLYMQRST